MVIPKFIILQTVLLVNEIIHGAVMEATIKVESDALHTHHLLERLKTFVSDSHTIAGTSITNDTLQANYDFNKNVLSVSIKYIILQNTSKLSNVNVALSIRFPQISNQRILLEDLHGNYIPKVGYQQRNKKHNEAITGSTESNDEDHNFVDSILDFITATIEPFVVTLVHIVLNGILGHYLTKSFEQFYLEVF